MSDRLVCGIVGAACLAGLTGAQSTPLLQDPLTSQATSQHLVEPLSQPSLSKRWELTKRGVLFCVSNCDHEASFWKSRRAWVGRNHLEIVLDHDLAETIEHNDSSRVLIIRGDCRGVVTLPRGGVVHVLGDLSGTIKSKEDVEIVIGGDLADTGVIQAEGSCHVFNGGDLLGRVKFSSSGALWIQGDARGAIETGRPSCRVLVGGDCAATFVPPTTGRRMVRIDVRGFMAFEEITKLLEIDWGIVNMSVGRSDTEPGIFDFGFIAASQTVVIHEKGAQTPRAPVAGATSKVRDLELKSLQGEAVKLSQYEGKVLLVVNVASECSYAEQYAGLQKLYETYADKGLVVLGFPSNDFGGLESGSPEQIREFCTGRGVTFTIFEKTGVASGETQGRLYNLLEAETGKLPRWNFGKYLVSRDGKEIEFFDTKIEPDDEVLVKAIKRALKTD